MSTNKDNFRPHSTELGKRSKNQILPMPTSMLGSIWWSRLLKIGPAHTESYLQQTMHKQRAQAPMNFSFEILFYLPIVRNLSKNISFFFPINKKEDSSFSYFPTIDGLAWLRFLTRLTWINLEKPWSAPCASTEKQKQSAHSLRRHYPVQVQRDFLSRPH